MAFLRIFLLQSQQKRATLLHRPLIFMWKVLRVVIWHFFWDFEMNNLMALMLTIFLRFRYLIKASKILKDFSLFCPNQESKIVSNSTYLSMLYYVGFGQFDQWLMDFWITDFWKERKKGTYVPPSRYPAQNIPELNFLGP